MVAAPPRTPARPSGTVRGALVLAGAFLLAGCGAGGYPGDGGYPPDPLPPALQGSVYVDNYAPEWVETFFMAPAATGDWSGEMLGWPLAPGESAYVGDVPEDLYDAEADLEYGDLVEWLDVWVPAGDATWFEIW